MERRKFIRNLTIGTSVAALPIGVSAKNTLSNPAKKVRFGIITDVHNDVMHDGEYRLRSFLNAAKTKDLDFIIQLGDFCQPKEANKEFFDLFNNYPGIKYHVIGNHDFDAVNVPDKLSVVKNFYGLISTYYSFDAANFHFIVLDGNDENPKPWNGYHRYIGTKQQLWLKNDLKKTLKPTILFSHQSLEAKGGVANRKETRTIIENYTTKSGHPKVVACLSGHHHTDYLKSINKIPYIQINSMSYKWVGDKYKYTRFSKQIEENFPNLDKTCPYKEPLYTVLTLDSEQEVLHLEGKKTSFINPTPNELKIPGAEKMNPTITERNLKI